jgi:inorganic pyrophosphatase
MRLRSRALRILRVLIALVILCGTALGAATRAAGVARSPDAEHAEDVRQVDPYTLIAPQSFLDGYPPIVNDSAINVVIEIPAGTNAKWEVRKHDGALVWEFKNGKPRVVEYLPYPVNYGMIPRTLLPAADGGDGDPLDVILLDAAQPRGSVLRARPVAVLRLLDGGEVDDKIVAIGAESALADARTISLEALRVNYPGLLDILEIWFSSYKGPGVMESKGFDDADAAWAMIHTAVAEYRASQ